MVPAKVAYKTSWMIHLRVLRILMVRPISRVCRMAKETGSLRAPTKLGFQCEGCSFEGVKNLDGVRSMVLTKPCLRDWPISTVLRMEAET